MVWNPLGSLSFAIPSLWERIREVFIGGVGRTFVRLNYEEVWDSKICLHSTKLVLLRR